MKTDLQVILQQRKRLQARKVNKSPSHRQFALTVKFLRARYEFAHLSSFKTRITIVKVKNSLPFRAWLEEMCYASSSRNLPPHPIPASGDSNPRRLGL